MHLYSKKGHDLQLNDGPCEELDKVRVGKVIKLHPMDFAGIKPKLLVSEGDELRKNQPVYYDKNNPDVMFTSFASGIVSKIVYGERRLIQSIDIELIDNNNEIIFSQHESDEIKNLQKEKILETLCKSGCWPSIRRRPFSKIAIPGMLPKSIFITTQSTAPYSPSLQVMHDNININEVQACIDALRVLTNVPVHMVIPDDKQYPLFYDLKEINIHTFAGLHPVGNLGYHISKIDPIENKETVVWYLSLQNAVSIGKLFLTGKLDDQKIISIGGCPHKSINKHLMVNKGTLVSDILTKGMVGMEYRIISGDILSGIAVERDQAIGYYHETISVVNNEFIRQFMGWLSPGFNKYSISHSFLSSLFPKIKQTLTTSMNGDVRSIVPLGLIEKMCLLNILPTMLLKSIISRDIEFMEYLGIYECDPEDFSLCSFIDASKMDIMSIIQDGLDYAEIEG